MSALPSSLLSVNLISQRPSPSVSDVGDTVTERAVSQPVAVDVEQPVVGLTIAVHVDRRPTHLLDAVEAEPPQLPAAVDAHRPRARPVVGEVALAVQHGVVGDAIAVEVGQRVVDTAVAVDIETDPVERAVAVHIGVQRRGPHRRRPVAVRKAVVHTDSTAGQLLAFHHFISSAIASSWSSGPRSSRSSLR